MWVDSPSGVGGLRCRKYYRRPPATLTLKGILPRESASRGKNCCDMWVDSPSGGVGGLRGRKYYRRPPATLTLKGILPREVLREEKIALTCGWTPLQGSGVCAAKSLSEAAAATLALKGILPRKSASLSGIPTTIHRLRRYHKEIFGGFLKLIPVEASITIPIQPIDHFIGDHA